MFQSSLDEVLHEVDELDQEPGEDEIREYAELIGIDANKEPELLWIARAGITAPLPADWKPIQVNNGDELYFYNFKTGESSWEHPSDDKYRQMVVEERKKKSLNSKAADGSGSKVSTAKTPGKVATPPPASIAALKSLKSPAAINSTGKLAPIGSSGPPAKLQPLNSTPSGIATGSTGKANPKALAPILSTSASQFERPKTSRGPAEKENLEEKKSSEAKTVVGGGSRFLKKTDNNPKSSSKESQLAKGIQNVLQFPSEESSSESESSLESDLLPAQGTQKMDKVAQKVVLDVDELKSVPAGAVAFSNKPPVPPKSTVDPKPPMPAKSPLSSTSTAAGPEKQQPQLLPQPVTTSTTKALSNTPSNVEKTQKQLQEDYERQVKQLREQHDSKLKDVRSKFEDEEKKETEKIKRAMEDRLRSLKEKLQKDEELESRTTSSVHKKRMEEMQANFEKERVGLEKELRSKLETERQAVEKDLRRDIGDDIDSLKVSGVRDAKQKIDKELLEEERRLETEKKQRMEEMRDQMRKELDDWLRKEKERKLALMKIDIDKELSEWRKNEEVTRRSSLEKEITKDLDRQLAELKDQHNQRVSDIRREHEVELDRIRRRNKEIINDEMNSHQQRSELIRGESSEDFKQRQADALKSAELQLKAFRDELSALTKMTVNIRETLQPEVLRSQPDASPVQTSNLTPTKKSDEGTKRDRTKTAVVKSIDELLSPGTDNGQSPRTSSSNGRQKLDGLSSDDVLEKVARFLATQKATIDHQDVGILQPQEQRIDLVQPSNFAPALGFRAASSTAGGFVHMRNEFKALGNHLPNESVRAGQNIFRLQPKDAIDEFLDRKLKEYLKGSSAFSSVREQSQLAFPGGFGYQRGRDYGRRAFNVEAELNSLKRWLSDFENRIAEKATTSYARLPAPRNGECGLLPIDVGDRLPDQQSRADHTVSFNDDETVEV